MSPMDPPTLTGTTRGLVVALGFFYTGNRLEFSRVRNEPQLSSISGKEYYLTRNKKYLLKEMVGAFYDVPTGNSVIRCVGHCK